MTHGSTTSLPRDEARGYPPTSGWGWYLYGITRLEPAAPAQAARPAGLDSDAPVQMLPQGDLAAIVSPVPLTEFESDALRARLRDAVWLEQMARRHQRVVEVFHRERGVLPAKFGCVYAQWGDLATALTRAHDALLAQLERLAGCDEWGVRLYADRPTIQRRVAVEDSNVRQFQQELAGARPGRAYFLQRKQADLLAAATDQWLSALAQIGFDSLLRWSVAGQMSPRRNGPPLSVGDTEVLRAAFLVSRAGVPRLVEEIHRLAESQGGLRCEYSGPWPPYSFARLDGEGQQ